MLSQWCPLCVVSPWCYTEKQKELLDFSVLCMPLIIFWDCSIIMRKRGNIQELRHFFVCLSPQRHISQSQWLQLFLTWNVFCPQREPSYGVVCVCLSVYFLEGGWGRLHPRRVTMVTRCSLPPSGLGQVGRHGDWVVTDFVTSPLGHRGWVNLKNTCTRRHPCNACTHTCTWHGHWT